MHQKNNREPQQAPQQQLIHDRTNLSSIPDLPSSVIEMFFERGITTLIQLRNRRSLISILVENALPTTPDEARNIAQRLLELTGRSRGPLAPAQPVVAEVSV